jgi:L-aminopeptidase/D-esterase-like protein
VTEPAAPPAVSGPLSGVRVGHWSDQAALTGCTVVIFPAGTVASGEVRGGAPGTREWALLEPWRTVNRVDSLVLAGGSAFGLAACDGVSRWCEERGIGYPTLAGPVPIVVGAVLFDLDVGDPNRRPGADEGYAACVSAEQWPATPGNWSAGRRIGAGTGATLARRRGPEGRRPGGVGLAQCRDRELVVGAVVAVNAVGDLRGVAEDRKGAAAPDLEPPALGATTIGMVVTNADLDKLGCYLVAQACHDGLARALDPVHTSGDGDAMVAAAVGGVTAPVDQVTTLAATAVEEAVRAAAA